MAKDDLTKIHEELVADHVYVHPSMESVVSPDDEAALEAQVADAADPTYVVVFPLARNDNYGGKAADLLTRLHDAHPEPGIYLATTDQPRATDYTPVRIEGRQWGIGGEGDGEIDYTVTSLVGLEEHQDAPSALSRAVELLAMDPSEVNELQDKALERSSAEYRRENPPEDEDNPVVGGLITALVVVVLGFVAWRVVVSFRKQKQPAPLPASAMKRIRAAQGRELLARARTESQALGERIDESEIGPGDDTDAWQAALDHYAAVRRLLTPEEPDQLDVVGALVLTKRGIDALTSARAGSAWQPQVTCYLNPLHGRADKGRRIEWQGRTLEVPVCTECRTALRKKQIPDTFDVVRRGEAVHYFETDVEPWASTGYGSLEPDLLSRLNARR